MSSATGPDRCGSRLPVTLGPGVPAPVARACAVRDRSRLHLPLQDRPARAGTGPVRRLGPTRRWQPRHRGPVLGTLRHPRSGPRRPRRECANAVAPTHRGPLPRPGPFPTAAVHGAGGRVRARQRNELTAPGRRRRAAPATGARHGWSVCTPAPSIARHNRSASATERPATSASRITCVHPSSLRSGSGRGTATWTRTRSPAGSPLRRRRGRTRRSLRNPRSRYVNGQKESRV